MSCAEKYPKLTPLLRYLESLSAKMELPLLKQALVESDVTIDDVRSACVFGDKHYQRNKVACSDWFDLLVICWKPGQASLIHDHSGSSCGFKILSGTSTETIYQRSGGGNEVGDFVRPVSRRTYSVGELCLAQDQDIHRISNESATEELVTLHIYSPPLQMSYYALDPALNLPPDANDIELGKLLAGGRD